jgi:hypothetical protein
VPRWGKGASNIEAAQQHLPGVSVRFFGNQIGWKVQAFPGDFDVFDGVPGPGGGFPTVAVAWTVGSGR